MGAFLGSITGTTHKLVDLWVDSYTEKVGREVNKCFVGNELVMDLHLVTDTKRPQVCDGIYVSKDDDSVILLCVGYLYSIEGETITEKQSKEKPLGEIILDIYKHHGIKWLDRVNGQFAFVLWDRRDNRFYFGVDPIGAYALYYTQVGRDIYFASTMEPLLKLPNVGRHVNLIALQQMITFCSIAAPHTIVKEIKCVAAGTYLAFKDYKIKCCSYWDIDFTHECLRDYDVELEQMWVDRFDAIWSKTVNQIVRPEQKSRLLLSGGIDSSTVAIGVREQFPDIPLQSFSIDYQFASLSEREYQDMVASHIEAQHMVHEFTLDEFVECFSKAAIAVEGPFCELGTCAYYQMYQTLGKEGCDLISGLGVDELYAGYITYKVDRFRARDSLPSQEDLSLNRLFWGDGLFQYENPSYFQEISHQRELFTENAWELLNSDEDRLRPFFNTKVLEGRLSLLDRRSYIDFWLRLLNHKNYQIASKLSRKFGIITHYPFLQKEMINFATSLPQWMRLKNNTDKYVIRKAMAGRIPDQVIRRKKITLADFSYNEIIWPLYERYNMYFMTDYIQDIGIFSEGYLKQSITNLGKAKNTSQLFELKNIILTHISLPSFIDQYNLIL